MSDVVELAQVLLEIPETLARVGGDEAGEPDHDGYDDEAGEGEPVV